MKKTVYIALQQFAEEDDLPLRELADAGLAVERNTLGRRLKASELPAALARADAVIAGVEPYDAALLAALPRLSCISRLGAGTDAIDLAAAKARGVSVLTTRDEVVEPVAQMTVAMILALARNLTTHAADFAAGRWIKRTGRLMSELTVGLVGYGRIGRRVAELLTPFGPKLLFCDPAVKNAVSLETLLAESDVVSLHADRRAAEGPLLGRAQLSQMKAGSYIVNTARGHLINEAALHEALVSGHLAGAALDVFESEPYSGPLAALPNVLATPHVATLTRSSRAAMELGAVRNVVRHFGRDIV